MRYRGYRLIPKFTYVGGKRTNTCMTYILEFLSCVFFCICRKIYKSSYLKRLSHLPLYNYSEVYLWLECKIIRVTIYMIFLLITNVRKDHLLGSFFFHVDDTRVLNQN